MELKREEDIRNHIEAWLKQQGISVDREVTCGNGIRADLVTPDTVIEIKKQLNRGAIYQAHGQGVAYQKLLNKPKLLIVGLAPPSEVKYQEAQRIAENIRTEGVEVIFIDKDPKWEKAISSIAAALKSPIESRPAVRLPFEKTTVESAAGSKSDRSAGNNAASAATRPEKSGGPSIKDVWALLLIILLFLWVKAAVWRNDSVDDFDAQPSPELQLP